MIEGLKVITAKEMAQAEKKSIEEGALDSEYMLNAARAMAHAIAQYIAEKNLHKEIYVLAGKGNNGGDAFATATLLLKKDFSVHAFHFYPPEKCSPLCFEHRQNFQAAGGKITDVKNINALIFKKKGVILDGIFGTGFEGAVEGILLHAIEKANESELPILSIDIPSGLNGNTGKIKTDSIHATMTFFLENPKKGFFINEGFNVVGTLKRIFFGMDPKYIDQIYPEAFLIAEENISKLLPKIKRTRHKYEAGYVLGIGGSPGMEGAAIMSSWAALKAGAGIVRLFHEEGMETANAPLEIVKESCDFKSIEPILKEARRAKACFIGPGMGRTERAIQFVKKLIEHIEIPCICDADALYALAKFSKFSPKAPLILTPHRKEMLRLLHREEDFENDEELIGMCEHFATLHQLTLLLKGAPTWVFSPGKRPLIIHRGDPGMAKAGTGDVLTGIITALAAQGLNVLESTAIGAYLHALAGELAALNGSSYSIMATDLIQNLNQAFQLLQKKKLGK